MNNFQAFISPGPHSIVATNASELDAFLKDVRDYTQSAAPINEVTVISISPIPKKYGGTLQGVIEIDTITQQKRDTATSFEQPEETTGTYTIKSPTAISLDISEVQFLVFYDVQPKS